MPLNDDNEIKVKSFFAVKPDGLFGPKELTKEPTKEQQTKTVEESKFIPTAFEQKSQEQPKSEE